MCKVDGSILVWRGVLFDGTCSGTASRERRHFGGGTKVQIRRLELAGSLCNRAGGHILIFLDGLYWPLPPHSFRHVFDISFGGSARRFLI
jgi:hypothetical protein